MKLLIALMAVSLLYVPPVFAAANCQHSSSWQCQGHHSQSGQGSQTGTGIVTGGQTPNQGQTNAHLGTGGTNTVPMMTLQPATQITPMLALQPATNIVKPPQPVIAVPPKPQIVAPPKIPVKVPPIQVNPIATPSFTGTGKVPPMQVYMVPSKEITGYAAVPPKPIVNTPPMVPPKQPPVQVYAVPPRTFSGQGAVPLPQVVVVPPRITAPPLSPPRQVYPNPRPIIVGASRVPPQQVNSTPGLGTSGQGQSPSQPVAGTASAQVINQPTHLLTNNRAGQFAGGRQLTKTDYGQEIVEPGIMNSRVTLYRSHDVKEVVFKDTIPMDATGFHLNFVGIREPVFTMPDRPAVKVDHPPETQAETAANAKPFVFFFDYASAVIHPDQFGLYDDIVAEYQASGKKLVVISETDGFGSFEYNTALATHRGAAITTELQKRGVEADDIEVHLLVRHGRSDPSTEEAHRASSADRIAWIHFE